MKSLFLPFCVLPLLLVFTPALSQDDLNDLLKNAPPASSQPTSELDPNAPQNRTDHAATTAPKPPAEARLGTLSLSDGTSLVGPIWTTLHSPLRVWSADEKTYHDLDLALIKRIDVHVLAQTMEPDWRWLKEGSDQKIYSGKKYPNIELAYRFTFLNDQTFEGTIAAPIYILDHAQMHSLALYKKFRGTLDQTLSDLTYITSISLTAPPPPATTKRP